MIDNKTRSGSFGFVIKNKGEIMIYVMNERAYEVLKTGKADESKNPRGRFPFMKNHKPMNHKEIVEYVNFVYGLSDTVENVVVK